MWEIEVARQAGFEPRDIVFTGVGKSRAELECGVALDLKAINVESAGELARIEEIAARLGRVARVAVRVNPDIDAKSHPHISTGLRINKFGVALDEARHLLESFTRRPSLKLVAVHVHVGSQVTDLGPLRRAAALAAAISRELLDRGVPLEYVDLGGGLGVSYDGSAVASVSQYVSALVEELCRVQKHPAYATPDHARENPADTAHARRPGPCGLGAALPIVIEPGRSMVAPAGILVARVVDIKPRDAVSDFVVIDAGMTELLRPALYGAYHRIEPVALRDRPRKSYEIVGPVCESSDVVGRDRELPALEIGDLLAVRDAGAYGAAMASNYNRRPQPAEVLVENGSWSVIKRRQTVDDMLRLEQ